MPIVLADHGLVITAAPGTGSTSLVAAATAVPGACPVPEADVETDDGHQALDAKHATVAQLVAAGLLAPDHGLRIVTSTRNPFDFWAAEWERTRTHWLALARDPTSWVRRQPGALDRVLHAAATDFDPWVQEAVTDAAAAGGRHLNAGHVAEADVVLRMEHLEADATAAGLPLGPIGHHNRQDGRPPYWQRYGPGGRQVVTAAHRPDLERFGYTF